MGQTLVQNTIQSLGDWDALRVVLAIHRSGGLSGAARALGVNHATVSRALDRAEKALGTQLFVRLATGLEATEAGQRAVARAAMIEAEVLRLETDLAARDEAANGPLRLTAPPLILQSGLAEDLAAFHKAHPGIDLSVLGQDRVLDLHRREADVAVRVTRSPAESLWGRQITAQRAGWFASERLLRGLPANVREGEHVPILSFINWERPVPQSLADEVPGAQVALRLDDMVTAIALAQKDVGLVRMPMFLGRASGLVLVPGLALVDYMPIWALTHPDLRRTPRVAGLVRFLAKRFAARRTLYVGGGT